MIERRDVTIKRPEWNDITLTEAALYKTVIAGLLVLSLLFMFQWNSFAKATITAWAWTGLVIHWWLNAIMAGQWIGWKNRLEHHVEIAAPLALCSVAVIYMSVQSVREIENPPDWALIKLLVERQWFYALLQRCAQPLIIAGLVLLALTAMVVPLRWRRIKYAEDQPAYWQISWRTSRSNLAISDRNLTTRVWLSGSYFPGVDPVIMVSSFHDDNAGRVAIDKARWFAATPFVGAVALADGPADGPSAWMFIVGAMLAYVLIRRWELNVIDRDWPWPRHEIGYLSRLQAVTVEPLANYYNVSPEGKPKPGHILMAHFANGARCRVGVTEQSPAELQFAHTCITRDLIDNRAALYPPERPEAARSKPGEPQGAPNAQTADIEI